MKKHIIDYRTRAGRQARVLEEATQDMMDELFEASGDRGKVTLILGAKTLPELQKEMMGGVKGFMSIRHDTGDVSVFSEEELILAQLPT